MTEQEAVVDEPKVELAKPDEPKRRKAEREGGLGGLVPLGSWWWLKVDEKLSTSTKPDATEVLACVTKLGSNFAEVTTADDKHSWRLHLDDDFPDVTRPCPNAQAVIRGKIDEARGEVQVLMGKVQDVTKEIGLRQEASEGTALAVLSGQEDARGYERALTKAKDETLPGLFKEIEAATTTLKSWMKAEMLPLKAFTNDAKKVIGEVESRIFNVEIYAGVSEEAKLVRDGKVAPSTEKLHVFQAMAFMDEECLLDYKGGGMDFRDVPAFDRWLGKPENADRLLPFPRCMVAFRVRRRDKDRSEDAAYGGLLGAFIKFEHEQFDKKTFLYVRNGERIFRIDSQMEFGRLIFPSKGEFSVEPLYFKRGSSKTEFRTAREHQALLEKEAERKEKEDAWSRANPFSRFRARKLREDFAKWKTKRNSERAARYRERMDARGKFRVYTEVKTKGDYGTVDYVRTETKKKEPKGPVVHEEQVSCWRARDHEWSEPNYRYEWREKNPHYERWRESDTDGWQPFDSRSTEFDEAKAKLDKKLKEWNRVSLVVQGLYDRSEVLHPHPPVKLWDPEGFASAVEMVYDGEHVLYAGEAPDFDAYRRKTLESLGLGCYTIGQQAAWLEREREREQARRNRDDRLQGDESCVKSWWHPKGDKGPGFVSQVDIWRPNKKEAVYRWERYSEKANVFKPDPKDPGYGWKVRGKVRESITVPADQLFNVSAYRPGDYKQFFLDPRTRESYVEWAPLLLTAEDWHAGKVGKDERRSDSWEESGREDEGDDE